jgi:hypothetical protein
VRLRTVFEEAAAAALRAAVVVAAAAAKAAAAAEAVPGSFGDEHPLSRLVLQFLRTVRQLQQVEQQQQQHRRRSRGEWRPEDRDARIRGRIRVGLMDL